MPQAASEICIQWGADGGDAPLGTNEICKRLDMGRTNLRQRYLDPALAAGLIEPTLPETPNSRLQQYRLTAKGAGLLKS